MIFSEVYSSYYNAVARILGLAVKGELSERATYDAVRELAFSESVMTIPDALKSGSWPFILKNGGTPIEHLPTMPLTELQRRWLKTLTLDPRIQLFSPSISGLEEVCPLYDPSLLVYFDRYADGDPYDDPRYIAHFKTALTAVSERRRLFVRFIGTKGTRRACRCTPIKLEYSAKDDKFRLIAQAGDRPLTVNMARVSECTLLEAAEEAPQYTPDKRELTLELYDGRNALERAMLHFSHLEKETKQTDERRYTIKLTYYAEDETELIIRVLSFGPMLKVTAPREFREKLKARIARQMEIHKDSN